MDRFALWHLRGVFSDIYPSLHLSSLHIHHTCSRAEIVNTPVSELSPSSPVVLSDVMAPDLPKLQVSKRVWQSGQPGALLRRHSHHQERPWQPLLCRQLQVPRHSDRGCWRRVLHCHPRLPGNGRFSLTEYQMRWFVCMAVWQAVHLPVCLVSGSTLVVTAVWHLCRLTTVCNSLQHWHACNMWLVYS